MGGIIDWLSGANGAADKAGSYYQNALQQIQQSVNGPIGQSFVADQNAALQPQFKQQDQGLAAKEAAMGITNSGAAKNDFSQLGTDQSAVLAGADAPLYSSALGAYDNTAGQGAGAQVNAYQNAVGQFYGALSAAGSAAAGGGGGGSGNVTNPNPYDATIEANANNDAYGYGLYPDGTAGG